MVQNISLYVSKSTIRDGECVDVCWESNVPESIFLTIKDGYGTTRIDVPDSGSRKCWANHAKKNLVITLTAIQGGKKEVITKKVRIKGPLSGNAGVSRLRLWRERQQAKRAETTDTSLSTATRTVTETPPSRGRISDAVRITDNDVGKGGQDHSRNPVCPGDMPVRVPLALLIGSGTEAKAQTARLAYMRTLPHHCGI